MSTSLETTVVFLQRDNELLLAMKKRGFGSGKYNGPGGKIEPGETAEECAIRETAEEIGVRALTLTQVADLTFHETYNGASQDVHSHVYLCNKWEGEPAETEEMAPEWFLANKLPYERMWADDRHWLPYVLAGKKVRAEFWFDENNVVVDHTMRLVEEL